MTFPEGLKYTEHDEWVSVDGDIATVGITDYAQDQLGELVHVELPKVGKTIAQGAVICEVESVMAPWTTRPSRSTPTPTGAGSSRFGCRPRCLA